MSVKKGRDELSPEVAGELIFLCGAFLLGAVFGSFFASGFTMEQAAANGFIEISIHLLSSFKVYFLIHGILFILIFLGVFFRFGSIVVPFSIAVKGFLLAMAVTCFIRFFGIKGYFPALTAFLLSEAISLLGFLLLGCRSGTERTALSALRKRGYPAHRLEKREYLYAVLASFLCVLLSGWLQCCLMNQLTKIVLRWIQ